MHLCVTDVVSNLSALITTTESQELLKHRRIEYFGSENESFPYKKLKILGQGAFGEVFKARNNKTGRKVALKRMLHYDAETFVTEYKRNEEDILGLLNHENVIAFYGSCIESHGQDGLEASYYLVLGLCDMDLTRLIESNVEMTLGHKKNVVMQILVGLEYIHGQNVMHLDLKPQNILLTKAGIVKLADFGLAQVVKMNENQPWNNVVTRWYCPPEILLGKINFGPAVDMWGVGCIMAELWTIFPILMGSNNQDQLSHISRLCGSLTSSDWPDLENLNSGNKFNLLQGFKRQVKTRFGKMGPEACDLLDLFLVADPSKRIDAKQALKHQFFLTGPGPTDLQDLLEEVGKFKISPRTFSKWLILPFKLYNNFCVILPLLILYFYLFFFFIAHFNLPVPSILWH